MGVDTEQTINQPKPTYYRRIVLIGLVLFWATVAGFIWRLYA
jgi:hypothetical protein